MRHTLTSARLSLLVLAVLVATPTRGAAQVLEVPPFTVVDRPREFALSPDVAAGADSSMTFLWMSIADGGQSRSALVRRFASDGSSVGPAITLDAVADLTNPLLEPDTRGGFIASWRGWTGASSAIDAQLLDAAAAPAGPVLTPFSGTGGYASWLSSFTGASFGAVATWAQHPHVFARRFDPAGQPIGPTLLVRAYEAGGSVPTEAVATSNGGFVVVWDESPVVWARPYDAAGQPLAPARPLTDAFYSADVLASPLGGFTIVGSASGDAYDHPAGIWMQRFDATAVPLGPEVLVARTPTNDLTGLHGGFHPDGRLLVVWSFANSLGFGGGPFARPYDAVGKPLARASQFTDEPAVRVALSGRPDGRFVAAWERDRGLRAAVVALCAPPHHTGCGNGTVEPQCEGCDNGAANSSVAPNACRTTCETASCGDGVVDAGEACDDGNNLGCDACDPDCQLEVGHVCGDGILLEECGERCDDGAGNSDTVPDACRSTCVPPVCGDGVLDAGESCDDGNITSCDGCSDKCIPEPGLVCGDGILAHECGEQCDDANDVDGDGCITPCRLERIPGAGAPSTDCIVEWSIDNPANEPRYDKRGAINRVQSCVDGDPRCDFDGLPGQCTFHLRVCANNTDLAGCDPGERLLAWQLRAPSANSAAHRPELAAVRAALASVPGTILGPTARDVCSDVAEVPVFLQSTITGVKRGALTLKSQGVLYTGAKDKDVLRLVCLPAS